MEDTHEANMRGLWQDFRYAARGFAKNLGVTSIMVFTLALAIGAATAIFSVVYGVLLRPLTDIRPGNGLATEPERAAALADQEPDRPRVHCPADCRTRAGYR